MSYIVAIVSAVLLALCRSADPVTTSPASYAVNPEPSKADTLLAFRTDVYVQSREEPIGFQLTNISRRPLRVDLCAMRLHRQEESRWHVVPRPSDCQEESEPLPPGQTLEDQFQLSSRQPIGIYRLSVEVTSPSSDSLRTIYSNPFRLSYPDSD